MMNPRTPSFLFKGTAMGKALFSVRPLLLLLMLLMPPIADKLMLDSTSPSSSKIMDKKRQKMEGEEDYKSASKSGLSVIIY
jgi:hypothetical protein